MISFPAGPRPAPPRGGTQKAQAKKDAGRPGALPSLPAHFPPCRDRKIDEPPVLVPAPADAIGPGDPGREDLCRVIDTASQTSKVPLSSKAKADRGTFSRCLNGSMMKKYTRATGSNVYGGMSRSHLSAGFQDTQGLPQIVNADMKL